MMLASSTGPHRLQRHFVYVKCKSAVKPSLNGKKMERTEVLSVKASGKEPKE